MKISSLDICFYELLNLKNNNLEVVFGEKIIGNFSFNIEPISVFEIENCYKGKDLKKNELFILFEKGGDAMIGDL